MSMHWYTVVRHNQNLLVMVRMPRTLLDNHTDLVIHSMANLHLLTPWLLLLYGKVRFVEWEAELNVWRDDFAFFSALEIWLTVQFITIFSKQARMLSVKCLVCLSLRVALNEDHRTSNIVVERGTRWGECKECSSEYFRHPNGQLSCRLFRYSYCSGPNGSCGVPMMEHFKDGHWPKHSYCGGTECISD